MSCRLFMHSERSARLEIVLSACSIALLVFAGCSAVFPTEYTTEFTKNAFDAIESGDSIESVLNSLGDPFFSTTIAITENVHYDNYDIINARRRSDYVVEIIDDPNDVLAALFTSQPVVFSQVQDLLGVPSRVEPAQRRGLLLYSRKPGSTNPLKGPYKRYEIIYDPDLGEVIETRVYWHFD